MVMMMMMMMMVVVMVMIVLITMITIYFLDSTDLSKSGSDIHSISLDLDSRSSTPASTRVSLLIITSVLNLSVNKF